MTEKLKYFVNLVNFYSCLLLVFVLITTKYSIQIGIYFVFFSSYVVEFFTDSKWKRFSWDKKTIFFFVMFLFFSLAIIYYPFDKSHHYFKVLMEKRYPLLGFSVIGMFGVNRLYKLRYFIITIITASLSIILYLTLFKVGINSFLKDPNLFNVARAKFINTHMQVNFYFNSAIIGIWYLLSTYWKKINVVYKSALIMSFCLFIFALFISEGRTGFIFGLVITVFIIFFELWKRKKTYGILFGFLIPWIAVVAISTHQRMNYDLIKNEPRYFLWQAGISVVKDSPILGHGISEAQTKFDSAREIYQTEDYKEGWKESKLLDCHSQYIQTWMEFGILGLLTLLFIYFAPIFLVLKKRRKIMILFISLCLFQSAFDMFVTGYFSAIFCLWLIFLLKTRTNETKNYVTEAVR